MAGSGSSRWEEPHTDAVPEEAAGLDRAAQSTAGAGGGKAVDVMTRSDAGLSSGALGEGGQKGTRERPNAGAVESLQAGDCGTYLIIGKDVVAREYRVLLKNTEGKDVGVVKWPFDAQEGEPKPSGLSSGRPLRRESLTAEPSQRSRDSSYVDGDWLEEYERLTLSGWEDSSLLEEERREREASSRAIPTTFGCTRIVEPAEPPGPALPAGSAWAQHAGVPGEMGTERFHVRSDDEDSSDRQSMSRDSFEGFLRELGVEDPSAIEKHWNAMNQGGRVRPTTTRPRLRGKLQRKPISQLHCKSCCFANVSDQKRPRAWKSVRVHRRMNGMHRTVLLRPEMGDSCVYGKARTGSRGRSQGTCRAAHRSGLCHGRSDTSQ